MRLITAVAACLLACAPAGAAPADASGPVGADFDLEFRSGIAVTRRLASGARLGLAGYHVSNGGLHRPNNGAETLVLFLTLPVRR
jgi:hypothetical protein